ncbi:YybS family protein [Virgibacillus sp. NKC19-3]|uniref:YybS family protein n=1 Tax=Virgibacillus saliphilus TaxID=2831674 RepID=UPI001C9B4DBD|nr:YybS family protein [Virgibacillus sp. NKC19-3]MBY7145139.1 YybS family protein [Virgibacillus sp. NKC19-3]
MNQSKRLTDGALLTAIFMVLLLVAVFVPVLSIFAMFVLPVPFVIYASRYNWKPTLVMMVVAALLTTLFAVTFTLPIAILMGFGGLMIGSAIYQNVSAYETWARGTFGFIVGLLFVFVYTQVLLDINWIEEFEATLGESMQMSAELLEQFGVEGQQLEEASSLLEEQVGLLTDLFPVGLAIAGVVLAFISQWLSFKVINRIERKQLQFPPFRKLQFPVSVIWIYLVALVFSLMELDPDNILYLGTQNLLVITGLVMSLQGISFIFFYAHHKNISKAVPILSVVLIIIFAPLLYLVRILGIIDIGFRLRDRMTDNNEK